MKISFHTLGCKVNQYETEVLKAAFIEAGFETGSFDEPCDAYVINTCSVTAVSDKKSRQLIRRARKLSPTAIIAVTGCYSQTHPDEAAAIDEVDIITGTSGRLELIDLVNEGLKRRKKTVKVEDVMKIRSFETMGEASFDGRTRASVKIQDGCSNFCSYCIIPYARGPARSRPLDEIVTEARKLVSSGFHEIVLTGIHIANYGQGGSGSLLEVLSAVDRIEGDFRLRLGSLEPRIFNDEFIEGCASLSHLCPHFHISLQSGCDETLKRMNRKYTAAQYAAAVERLRRSIPLLSVTTDVMVGFPGEDEEEFSRSLSFVESMDFLHCHVFAYSKRPGTVAADMPNQVKNKVKEERAHAMSRAADLGRRRFLEPFVGRELEVLFESEVEPGILEGLSQNYITIRALGEASQLGLFSRVELKSVKEDHCLGEILKK